MKPALSIYWRGYPKALVYMLQSTEYQTVPYLKWIWRTQDFSSVMNRRTLDKTKAARLLLLSLYLGIGVEFVISILMIVLGVKGQFAGGVAFGLALILIYPILWAHLLIVPLALGRLLISGPEERRLIEESQPQFAAHPGKKIAVVGSYGKTTMKELLNTVLSEGLKVAATPANKNVSISHARFVKRLDGDEDVLVIEYGEGAPGDVARFTKLTRPTHAVITGLAPAHLDQYKTLQAAGEDIFSVASAVKPERFYVNADSPDCEAFMKPTFQTFSNDGALGWKVSDIVVELSGTSFTLTKDKHSLKLRSGLVGQHQVGFLAFVAAFALDLGLTQHQVQTGIAKTKPFEHRMQPYSIGGAWVVDDTYNGNLEGIRAGTQLLRDLKADRKMYVTPGLVDQGDEADRVHKQVGKLIAAAKPNIVVLMQNSATSSIKAGLDEAKFKGELRLEQNPLEFYSNLAHFVAKGDLVVMQNDWTDNYA